MKTSPHFYLFPRLSTVASMLGAVNLLILSLFLALHNGVGTASPKPTPSSAWSLPLSAKPRSRRSLTGPQLLGTGSFEFDLLSNTAVSQPITRTVGSFFSNTIPWREKHVS